MSLIAAVMCGWAGSATAQDPGSSRFESGSKLYRPREWKAEDIPVPFVKGPEEKPATEDTPPVDSGPKFKISRFEVLGDTLLGLKEIDGVLAPFIVAEGSFATVEKARSALQEHYSAAGFLTIGVAIPPQSIDDGVVQLKVIEARLGDVSIENEGRQWVSDARIEELAPHVRSGNLLRQNDLQEDMQRANGKPGVVVRPVMSAGRRPDTVDLKLIVEDRAPVHASVELNNQRTAGSPRLRALASLSYGNLFDLDHNLSLAYISTPTSQMKDVQVISAAYAVPVPFRERDRFSLSYAYSASTSGVPNAPLPLSSIGRGLGVTARYEVALSDWANETTGAYFSHGASLSFDLKRIESTLVSDFGKDLRPLRSRPFSLGYWFEYGSQHARTSLSLTGKVNRAGLLGGADGDAFVFSRGAKEDTTKVTGDYEVLNWNVEQVLRLSSITRSLALGRWLWDTRSAPMPLERDWRIVLRTTGQLTSEPLVPVEQFSAGGLRTVRGYLDAELFGDMGFGFQSELVSRALRMQFGRRDLTGQVLAFYDFMYLKNTEPAEGQSRRHQYLASFGLGVRANWGGGINSELVLGWPLIDSPNSEQSALRIDFRLVMGF